MGLLLINLMNQKNNVRRRIIFALLILLLSPGNVFSQISGSKSQWVYRGKDGKLQYKTTPSGDRIMDFSYSGYMGGGVALPSIPEVITVKPLTGSDATMRIQKAINSIAALPVKNGFRGAGLLEAGTFLCKEALLIPADGIVLRGSGSGKEGTIIKMEGDRHPAIIIARKKEYLPENKKGQPDEIELSRNTAKVTSSYIPSGTTVFSIDNITGLRVGDLISFYRPVTDAWIHFMHMDDLIRDGKHQTWIANNRRSISERRIKAISGKFITVDMPMADSYNADYMLAQKATISENKISQRITHAGVENIHIQCAPLEIDYGHAPYSGIRIEGDNCWVKNVYFEETMNTTTIAGNNNTLEKLVIKHTYPNLGASKPTDFNIEGSCNLIDKCQVTGDNTYFVWTGSLINGPNVVLNSIFLGHGSRIQPHQRWSTGLLVDNCVVPGGGIDFMNRGVAGSGHGWTMGWAVAWNCIAKTYTIQKPPGAMNWAIGCRGTRIRTARLFDSAPILGEGTFESHGSPVTPKSLYLTQLADRLGRQALTNIGYSGTAGSMVTDQHVQPLPPLKRLKDPLLGIDLAMYRPVNVNTIRNKNLKFGGEKALDGIDSTYWATNDGVAKATFEVDTEGPMKINAIEISEAPGFLMRVHNYKIEGQVESGWKLLGVGTSIGKNKILRFPKVTVWKVRLTILDLDQYAAISKVGLFFDKNGEALN
jgi:hypothetical protein